MIDEELDYFDIARIKRIVCPNILLCCIASLTYEIQYNRNRSDEAIFVRNFDLNRNIIIQCAHEHGITDNKIKIVCDNLSPKLYPTPVQIESLMPLIYCKYSKFEKLIPDNDMLQMNEEERKERKQLKPIARKQFKIHRRKWSVLIMNENKSNKATEFQKEQVETAKQVLEYKKAAEANVVSIIYKQPDLLSESDLSFSDFHNESWKAFFAIAYGILITEKKATLDDITVGLYLEKHPDLKMIYEELGGYKTVVEMISYVDTRNYNGYLMELKKWKAVLRLVVFGFNVKDRLEEFSDMSKEEIYTEFKTKLTEIFE